MNDKIFNTIKKRVDEIYTTAPNDLRIPILTSIYKQSTNPLKNFPFKLLIPISIAGSIVIYILFGYLTFHLVSILQYGF